MAWEDEVVFRAYERRTGPESDFTRLLSWEHHYLRQYLERLSRSLTGESPQARFEWAAFAGLLAGHNRREEARAYPAVERAFTMSEQRVLITMLQTL